MKHNRKLIASILEIIIGIALLVFVGFDETDSYWGGAGSALIGVGILFLLREIKYRKNPDYKEQVDTETNDERNRYLGMKTWSWTGYATVLILAVSSIGCKIAGYSDISTLLGSIVCLMAVLYWLIYVYLSKKY